MLTSSMCNGRLFHNTSLRIVIQPHKKYVSYVYITYSKYLYHSDIINIMLGIKT